MYANLEKILKKHQQISEFCGLKNIIFWSYFRIKINSADRIMEFQIQVGKGQSLNKGDQEKMGEALSD